MEEVRELMSDVIGRVADRLDQMQIVELRNEVDLSTKAVEGNGGESGGEDCTCAICLDEPAQQDRCAIVGCDHVYCVSCIVHWASTRPEAARCPTCKKPFSLISLIKKLDGSLSPNPVEETVAMVARSAWFREWLSVREQSKSPSLGSTQDTGPRSAYSLMQEEWAEDELYSYFEQEFDEDDVEDYYVGRSAGRRHAFGNRPFGPNGYMRAGRKLAAVPVPKPPKGKGTGGRGSCSSCSTSQTTQKTAQKGRRAQRKAKRASADQ